MFLKFFTNFFNILLLIIITLAIINGQFELNKECFCKNNEAVDNCECNDHSIDVFNNVNVYPILRELLQRDFFKFYKVLFLNIFIYIYIYFYLGKYGAAVPILE